MSRQKAEAAALVRAYFGVCLDRYGHDPRGVDWQSAVAQRARFAAVLAVGDLHGATLLDAGCGLGDFYGYLRERGIAARYTGCDLSTPHVEAARTAYPDARFVAADVQEILAGERFDYVIGCGLLHLRVPRWNRWAWSIVRAMYDGCLRGVAFTLPRRGAGHPPVLAAVDPADWLARLRTLSPTAEAHPLDPWGDTVFLLRKHNTYRPRQGRATLLHPRGTHPDSSRACQPTALAGARWTRYPAADRAPVSLVLLAEPST